MRFSSSQAVVEAVRQFGLDATAVRPIRSGHVNKHWRLETPSGSYVLRRYRPERSLAAIEYEHDALQHVARHGWPVAPAIAAVDGRSIVQVDGRSYALFPRLAGRRAPYGNLRRTRANGAMLARFHRDMASWGVGQRDGFGRLSELDIFVRAATPFATFDDLLRAFERGHRDLGRAVRAERQASLRELSRLGYRDLPATLIHGDFYLGNLFFQSGQLSGLLDFDFVRLDARVADLAMNLALDCAAPPTYNDLRPAAVEACVAGYAGESPLTEAELRLVLPLVRADRMGLINFRLCEWASGRKARALRSIHRSLEVRLPSLRNRWSELDQAVRAGAKNAATSSPARRGRGTR